MFSSPYVKACLKLVMWQDTIFSPKSFMQYGQQRNFQVLRSVSLGSLVSVIFYYEKEILV